MTIPAQPAAAVRVEVPGAASAPEAAVATATEVAQQASDRFTSDSMPAPILASPAPIEPDLPDLTDFVEPTAPTAGLRLWHEDCLGCSALCDPQTPLTAESTPSCHFTFDNGSCPAKVIHFIFVKKVVEAQRKAEHHVDMAVKWLANNEGASVLLRVETQSRFLTAIAKYEDAALAADTCARINRLFS